MLWAIRRLYVSIRETPDLRELFDQRMIIYHIISFSVYLVSIVITYVFYGLWQDPNNTK